MQNEGNMNTRISEKTSAIRWQSGPSTAPLPPLAAGLPVLGNVIELADDVLRFLTKQYHKLGPIFRIRALNETYTVIAGRDANLFFAREGSKHFRSKEFWQGMDDELGAEVSLISSDGELHTRLRLLQKRGFGKAVIETQLPTVAELATKAVTQWPVGESRPVLSFIQDLVTEQLGAIIIGQGPGEYVADIRTFIRTALLVRVTRQRPGFLLYTPAYRRAKARSLALGRKIVEDHRRNLPINRPPNLVDDAIAAVAQGDLIKDKDLTPMALGPYIAGLDTASNTIAFLLYALYKHPEVRKLVQAEAEALFADGTPTPERLNRADVLHRTVLETLRRYPIAPVVQRTVTQPFEFAGYRVDAGQRIFIGTTVAHFLPELHPDPYRFDIDRYLPPRNEHRTPGAFAPFSLGAHTCLGAGLAEIQIMLTVAALIRAGQFAIDPPDYQLKTRAAPTPAPNNNFRIRRVG
jgi:cytochrome P450